MTKSEIKKELRELLNTGKVEFKDPSDKDYLLKVLKEDGIREFYDALDVCETIKADWDALDDLEQEFSSIE